MTEAQESMETSRPEIMFIYPNRTLGRRKVFAKTSWVAADILKLTTVSKKEANEFLARHESHLQQQMIQTGWFYLEEMLRSEGFDVNEEPDYCS